MLGVNEIKHWETISTPVVVALCESLMAKLEESDIRRLRSADPDRYYRSLKTQFKELDDRYPGIFNLIIQYGRCTPPIPGEPKGVDIIFKVRDMLQKRDAINAKMAQGMCREDAGKKEDMEVDYVEAKRFIRGKVIPADQFDEIVKPPDQREENDSESVTSKIKKEHVHESA